MAGLINKTSDNAYISNLKSTAITQNGAFVVPDYSAGTATAAADATAGDGYGLLYVNNVNTKIDQELVADADFSVASGDYLRAKALKVGDVITTDQSAVLAVDAIAAVGVAGKLEAIGTRTPVLRFQIIEVTTLYGTAAVKAIVIAN